MEIILNGKKIPLEREMTVSEFIENLGKEKNMKERKRTAREREKGGGEGKGEEREEKKGEKW